VAVLTQRFSAENLPLPKLQVLIYPWVQLFNNHLPSTIQYTKSGLLSTTMPIPKLSAWYMGIQRVTEEIEMCLMSNNHTALLTDYDFRKKIESYLDINQIPEKYKTGRTYYKFHEMQKDIMYPEYLDPTNILIREPEVASLLRQLSDPRVSPLFADDSKLKGLPRAYFVILEWDSLKDEGLLYAERLKKAGTSVHINFYENAFHGIIPFTNEKYGYQAARTIQQDLIKYLKTNL
jgi:acetyl esterase/lipase